MIKKIIVMLILILNVQLIKAIDSVSCNQCYNVQNQILSLRNQISSLQAKSVSPTDPQMVKLQIQIKAAVAAVTPACDACKASRVQ